MDQVPEAEGVEPEVEREELRRAQPIVSLEACSPLRGAQLPLVPQKVRADADRCLRFECMRAVQEPAVACVGEVEVPVAHDESIRQGRTKPSGNGSTNNDGRSSATISPPCVSSTSAATSAPDSTGSGSTSIP